MRKRHRKKWFKKFLAEVDEDQQVRAENQVTADEFRALDSLASTDAEWVPFDQWYPHMLRTGWGPAVYSVRVVEDRREENK